jgi:acyl carrier protein
MDAEQLALAKRIVDGLNLEIEATAIDPVQPLFGEGLGLDSIDALELAVIVDRSYGVKIQGQEHGRAAFASLDTLLGYIRAHAPAKPA